MGYGLSSDATMENVDGTSVVTTSAGDAAVFNETAGAMLELLLETQGIDAAVKGIVERYDVDAQAAKADLSDLVASLAARGLLVCDGAST
jgi:hypothetical protein